MTPLVLLSVRKLYTEFAIKSGVLLKTTGVVKAVRAFDITVHSKETVALVGESGCGKTTAARSILHLVKPTSGEISFDGIDLMRLDKKTMRALRRRMQIIFQDPVGSLDPRQTVGDILAEPLIIHEPLTRRIRRDRVVDTLERVGLSSEYVDRFPHEFSGGQRQRIGIGRALMSNPDFIVCDEPVSALDVSVQAQILNLLADLRHQLGLSYLFISHNLSVVRHVADTIAVMYLGSIVEQASCKELFDAPQHPYTKALLAAVPTLSVEHKRVRLPLIGETPSPLYPPTGCAFHPRCPHTRMLASNAPKSDTALLSDVSGSIPIMRLCKDQMPSLDVYDVNALSHVCACWYASSKSTQDIYTHA